MSDVTITEQGVSTVTCGGCGKAFRGARGLASHQNHRNAAAGCKPAPTAKQVSEVAAPRNISGNVTVYETADAALDAIEAQFYTDLQPEAIITMVGGETTVEQLATGEATAESTTATGSFADRDELISGRRIFSIVPADVRTVLVKVDSLDKWAVRVHADDAYSIARTADSSTVVKVTKHEAGGETVVTDYYWNDGLRVRMTEKCAV